MKGKIFCLRVVLKNVFGNIKFVKTAATPSEGKKTKWNCAKKKNYKRNVQSSFPFPSLKSYLQIIGKCVYKRIVRRYCQT